MLKKNSGIFDREIPENLGEVLQQDRDLDLASQLSRALKAVADAEEKYIAFVSQRKVSQRKADADDSGPGWVYEAGQLRDLLKLLQNSLSPLSFPEVLRLIGKKRITHSEILRRAHAQTRDTIPGDEALHKLGEMTVERILAEMFAIAELTVKTEIALDEHERHAKIGQKSLAGARTGQAETHGTPEEKRSRWIEHKTEFDRVKRSRPNLSDTSAAKHAAKKFVRDDKEISYKTILRSVHELKKETNSK